MTTERPIVLIVGPTAAGKTALAIELAERLPGGGECLSADSMQVYRGMDIGTAKPSPAERARVPHHLVDLVDASDDGFTVDDWLRQAEDVISDIRRRDRWPIVVGGTNLYIQALLFGLFDGPQPDALVREALQATDAIDLRAELERVDPDAASRIHPNDRRRTIRAVEVFRTTGRPISVWQQEWQAAAPRSDVRLIGLEYSVEAINRRINARVRSMMDAGWLDEVRGLQASVELGSQARAALGYAQLLDHLEGGQLLDEALEDIKIRTRRLGKQQRTWLRRFRHIPDSMWFDAEHNDTQAIASQCFAQLNQGGADGPIRVS
ncbi:MAG: tRNA (adenosine(37)-N6)-dimethylallyltransferase MiaA [Planctomycetota bacterium]